MILKILIVAPDEPGLPHHNDELQQLLTVRKGMQITPLVGVVTMAKLMAAMGREYEIFWFIGHSDATGLRLSDGTLSIKDLAPILRNARLIVLNSCASLAIAAAVREETNVDTIAAIAEIEDRSAFRFGSSLLRNLGQYRSFRKAFDASVTTGESDYVYLEAEGAGAVINDDLTKAMYELKVEIVVLTQRVSHLESSLTRLPTAAPNEVVLRFILVALLLLCFLIGYGIFLFGRS